MKENVILTDTIVDKNWEFYVGIQKESKLEWSIQCWNNAGIKDGKLFNLKRIFGYFHHAFTIFMKRRKYSRIVSWQQFYGLIFTFYCMLFHVKKNCELTVMTFIYKEKRGWLGNVYFKFIRKILQSGYIDNIIVFSKNEVDYYSEIFGVSKNLFKYLPLGIPRKQKLEPTTIPLPKRFFLSVGRSNRDYEFLFRCADEIKQYEVVVITDIFDSKLAIPSNVKVLNGIRGEEYFKILEKCEAVLIPLKDSNISSGQLVMLQAMQHKKPIIITESNSISEYVKDSVNALIVKKSVDDFNKAVVKIATDKEIANKLASNGYEIYKTKFSLEVLGKKVGSLYKAESTLEVEL